MAHKKCFKCGATKPLHDFYKHAQMADGHLNKCKECMKIDVRNNRVAKIEYYREYDKQRANKPHRVKAREDYQKTEAGRKSLNKSRKKWLAVNFIKRGAENMVNNAVRDGRLYKPKNCQECGKGGRIHGHHDDYAKPLDVRWLCPACHCAWHKINGEGANAR